MNNIIKIKNVVLIGKFDEKERDSILSQYPNSRLIECGPITSDIRATLYQINDCIEKHDPEIVILKRDREMEILGRDE
ncbi:hypothetical protein J7J62_07815 [bacterium]|nr:hypothetical protein [bacterium]